MVNTKAQLTGALIIAFLLAIGANLLLDSGCGINGVITAHGRACIN